MASDVDAGSPAEAAAAAEAGAWATRLARTFKTCRLYDGGNPTVVRFREDLHSALRELLTRHAPLTLTVTSRALELSGTAVYTAGSREDNLAAIFHRDGIRRITFRPEITQGELDTLVDSMLHVTGPDAGDDDLVTLLWSANLSNIEFVAAPLEGDIEGGGLDDAEGDRSMPWPHGTGAATASAGGSAGGPADDDGRPRSDDCDTLARAGDLDQAFEELESTAIHEMERLQGIHEEELQSSIVTRCIETLTDCLATETTPGDREELARFIPRVLREAIVTADWPAAHTAMHLLRQCDPEWSSEAFFQGLAGASSASTVRELVATLDRQGDEGVEAFLALANEFGEPSAEWLMQVLAESQQQRTRRPLARALATLVKNNPERLLAWMHDPRWYVVRNLVHILGWIGGDGVTGYLAAAIDHPEFRVRREIVAALSSASPEVARPILMKMLTRAEPRLFAMIVHQLAHFRDDSVVRHFVEILRGAEFQERSDDEKRAIYIALANEGDDVIPSLEQEFARGGLFTGGLDLHWQSVARCLARIGTPAAREALDRGARSSRSGVRKACAMALASLQTRDD
ncbi:MAG TPA: HEAT repeat domain-containing protein [Candidatus Udaeobacter sp.]|nr:HEAT repeat domain-containing protein [Candidatus Udaeobacter sp.]